MKTQMVGKVGDEIVIAGHSVGEHASTGMIEEVLGEPEHPHYRVRSEAGTSRSTTPPATRPSEPSRQ